MRWHRRAVVALALCGATATAACGTTSSGGRKDEAGPAAGVAAGPIQEKVRAHEALTAELRTVQESFLASLQAYERKKFAHQMAIANQLPLSPANEDSIQQVLVIANDGNRVSSELVEAVRQLNEALVSRAAAARRQAQIDAQLLDGEIEAFRSREKAAELAAEELKQVREAEQALRQAQLDQQQALRTLTAKEADEWTTVHADATARDAARTQLKEVREQLDTAYAKLLEAAERLDGAWDRMHGRLQELAAAKKARYGERLKSLVTERAQSSRELAGARQWLKVTTLTRAQKRAREVVQEGDLSSVLAGAFKKAAARREFLASVKAEEDAALEARAKMLAEEKKLVETRKRLVQLENEIAALGY